MFCKHYQWLLDHAGEYQILPDNSTWFDEENKPFVNKFSMAYKGTQVSCMTLTEAIEWFENNK